MENYALEGKPHGKRILVRPDAAERQTKGGIWIPDMAQEKPSKGTIVQVGYDDENEKELTLLPGQQVLFGKYSGHVITFDSEEYLLMFDHDVIYAWPTTVEGSID